MKILSLILTIVALSSCTSFSQKDLTEIKKVAIVAGMEDKLQLQGTGLTIFEGSTNKADISSWKLVDRIANQVAAAAKAQHPEMEFTIIDRAQYPYKPEPGSIAKIAEQMRNAGYDTLLLITNAGIYSSNTGTQILGARQAGFVVWEKSLFGKELATFICAQYRLDLIKTADNKFLKTAGTADIYGQPTFVLKPKPFAEYSPSEIDTIRNALIDHIDTTTQKSTNAVFSPATNLE